MPKMQPPSIGFVPVGSSLIKHTERRAYKEIGHEAHPYYNANQPDSKLTNQKTDRKGKSS